MNESLVFSVKHAITTTADHENLVGKGTHIKVIDMLQYKFWWRVPFYSSLYSRVTYKHFFFWLVLPCSESNREKGEKNLLYVFWNCGGSSRDDHRVVLSSSVCVIG